MDTLRDIVNSSFAYWLMILLIIGIGLLIIGIIILARRVNRYNKQSRCGYCGALLQEDHACIGHTRLCSLCTKKSLLFHKGLYYLSLPFTILLMGASLVWAFYEGIEWNLLFTLFSMVITNFQLRKSIQQHSPESTEASTLHLFFQRTAVIGLKWFSKTWLALAVLAAGTGYLFRDQLLAAGYRFHCNAAYRKKDYDNAITSCTKAIRFAPAEASHYRQRARAYTYRHYDNAVADYSKAIELDPRNGDFYRERAELYINRSTPDEQKYGLAIADYSKALQITPSGELFGKRGVAYFRIHDYDNAMNDFHKALEMEPDTLWVYKYLGTIYAKHHQYESAIADYTEYLQGDSCQCNNLTDVYMHRGVLHTLLGNSSQAHKDFLHALNQDAAFLENYYVWGSETPPGEYDFAIGVLTNALKQEPKNALLYLSKAFVCEQAGHLSEAFLAYQGFLAYSDASHRTFRELANARMKFIHPAVAHPSGYRPTGQQAIQHYTDALTLDNTNPRTYLYRGYSYLGHNGYERAIHDFTKTLQLAPDWYVAYELRAAAYRNLKQYEQALSDYTTVIEQDPSSSAYWERGRIYQFQRSYQKAIADYTSSLDIQQQHKKYHNGLEWKYLWRGNLYAALQDYDAALADYARTTARNSDNIEAYICRGDAYAEKGDDARSAAEYTKAAELTSTYLDSDHIRRAIAYERLGQYDQARHEFSQGSSDERNSITAWIWLGQISLGQGEYKRALTEFTSALNLSNAHAPIHIWQGLTYTMQGQPSQALSAYHTAIERDPNVTGTSDLSFRLCSSRLKYTQSLHASIAMLKRLPSDRLDVMFGKAILYEKTERITEAIEAYARFLQETSSQHPLLVKFARQSIANLEQRSAIVSRMQ